MLNRMAKKKRAAGTDRVAPSEQSLRDQEVLRANRELAAYFKGRRTEREARAALKIIKAFVRDRERQDAKDRTPLPGSAPAKPAADPRSPKHTRRRRPRARAAVPRDTAAAPPRADGPDSPDPATE
jgi:hypothetical protein